MVGHHVTAMVVQAEAGQMGDPQAALRNIGDLGRKALGELDALVVHLRDPKADWRSPLRPGCWTSMSSSPPPARAGCGGLVRMDEELGSERSAC